MTKLKFKYCPPVRHLCVLERENHVCTISGILLVLLGTILCLWSILNMNLKIGGSWRGIKKRAEEAPKEKFRVWIGMIMVFIGTIFQIIGALSSSVCPPQ